MSHDTVLCESCNTPFVLSKKVKDMLGSAEGSQILKLEKLLPFCPRCRAQTFPHDSRFGTESDCYIPLVSSVSYACILSAEDAPDTSVASTPSAFPPNGTPGPPTHPDYCCPYPILLPTVSLFRHRNDTGACNLPFPSREALFAEKYFKLLKFYHLGFDQLPPEQPNSLCIRDAIPQRRTQKPQKRQTISNLNEII